MTTTAEALVVVGTVAVAARSRFGRHPAALLLPAGLVWWPLPATALALAHLALQRVKAMRVERVRVDRSAAQVVTVAEMTSLGLAAGRNIPMALGAAASAVGDPAHTHVVSLLRRARLTGLAHALAADETPMAPLSRRIATAVETGAPVRGALESLVEERLAVERNEGLIRARKLPVKLLFPLALLILPGFLVLTVGPALLTSIDRLA